ncbi:Transcription factor TGA like domain [Dillenia turbinata]|uniref:Transcription factor TGA like domain n=1 Tax=Dillenia turbinata TaxID=194707 RepID=A0AAN8VC44_9MAGN
MSVPPSSAQVMASAMAVGNENRESESFKKFFESWLVEQNQHLNELLTASTQHSNNNSSNQGEENEIRQLVDRVIKHYELYYAVKSSWAKQDVLSMLTPPWRSSLEDAFLWIGGWRPTMAFHLLYSKSGLQLEARLGHAEFYNFDLDLDLADLRPAQLEGIDSLQKDRIREEKEITEKMAKQQETVADSSMVDLSHVVSELMRKRSSEDGGARLEEQEVQLSVESALGPKEEGLEQILQLADDLRLRTLKGVIEILSPIQAVHFLIAAAELHLRFHDWGKRKDARQS